MEFSLGDLKSISILASSIKNFPDKDITDEIKNSLSAIELRMSNNNKTHLSMLSSSSDYNFSFFYSDIKTQIEECEKLCKVHHVFDLVYDKNGEEKRCTCVAKEVLYDSKNVYLKVHDSIKRQSLEIPINKILHISLRPNVANTVELNTTVVYLLKGRLAKIYRLKEHEHSRGYDENGNLIIVNRNEPFEKLLSRLMLYTTGCEIVSPKYLREDIMKLITDTISNYEK